MNQTNASPVPVPDPLGVVEAVTQGAVEDPGRKGFLSVATQATMSMPGNDYRTNSSQMDTSGEGESELDQSETENEGSEDRCVVRSVRGEETSIL